MNTTTTTATTTSDRREVALTKMVEALTPVKFRMAKDFASTGRLIFIEDGFVFTFAEVREAMVFAAFR